VFSATLAGLVALALVCTAVALAVGFDRFATLVPGGRELNVSGTTTPCSGGEQISVAVLITQGSRVARGQSAKRACTGKAQHWRVSAKRTDGAVFNEGAASASARATVTRESAAVATEGWADTLALRCPGPARSPHNGVLSQINLSPPRASSHAAGIAVVIRRHGRLSLILRAERMTPNTSHDAYAVWLYNTTHDNRLLGFVNPGVSSNGVVQTSGNLPSHAGCFGSLVVSRETEASPSHPHKIILSGDFTLR
jgi:hypothetical protein